MCRSTTCKTCGLASWAGCGQHIDEVMAAVPQAQRCPGHPKQERAHDGLLARLFSRR